MPQTVRTLLLNETWAVTLLDSAAEVAIVREVLRPLLITTATDRYVSVETADTRVAPP